MNERLFRSSDDRMLAGVAGGMAEAWDLDPSLVRIGWVVLTPLTAGFAILVYIVMAIVVPLDAPGPRPAPGASGPSAFSWSTNPAPTASAPLADVPAGPGSNPASTTVGGTGPVASPDPGAAPAPTPGPGVGAVGGPSPAPGAFGGPIGAGAGPAPGSSAWSDARRADRDARHAARHAARDARRAARGNGPGSGAIVGGLILILLGGGFLASELLPDFDWHTAWPIGLIAIGVILVAGSLRPRSSGS